MLRKIQNYLIPGLIIILLFLVGRIILKQKEKELQDLKETYNQTEEVKKPEIITEAYIQKILNIDRLSTYKCSYNGICTIKLDKKPKYFCTYKATVFLGINFSDVRISIKDNIITVGIPHTEISDATIDISSLDYMNIDKSIDTKSVFSDVYKKCLKDVKDKCSKDENLLKLAEENNKKSIEAIISPFVKDKGYELVFKNYEAEV